MKEKGRLTRDIHNFVRGKLSFDKELKLLDEILDSPQWMANLEMDMMLYQMFADFKLKSTSVVKWY